jgi:hypothetical protein
MPDSQTTTAIAQVAEALAMLLSVATDKRTQLPRGELYIPTWRSMAHGQHSLRPELQDF